MSNIIKFPELKNDLILRAARGEKTERAPVWIMRQAGRYLPEFRSMREKYDFFTICRTPELATEVTLQPINRYDGLLDAAIIFSDILVIPQALGLVVEMLPGKGPNFPDPLVLPEDIDTKLKDVIDVKRELGYVFDAITMTRKELNGRVPLLGFIGAPWTLMAYMIEGGGSNTLSKAKTWLFKYPNESKRLLQKITDVAIDFLIGQIKAGAQMVQIFESWGGELSPNDFNSFSLPYLTQISNKVKSQLKTEGLVPVPMIIFCKGSWYALESLSEIGYDVISLDWTIDPIYAKEITKGKVTLQGNMDPNVLYGDVEAIKSTVEKMLKKFGTNHKYIVNLGHGILPTVDPESTKIFLETVHKLRIIVELLREKLIHLTKKMVEIEKLKSSEYVTVRFIAKKLQSSCLKDVGKARIKKIMQMDEDVGKVAQATPVLISKALELFMQSLIDQACRETKARNAKRMSVSHLKKTIMVTEQFDFLKELVANIPDPVDSFEAEASTSSTVVVSGDEPDASKSPQSQPRKRRGRRRNVDDDDYEPTPSSSAAPIRTRRSVRRKKEVDDSS
nr:5203_t:CDS:10 [Entrophospora candida]